MISIIAYVEALLFKDFDFLFFFFLVLSMTLIVFITCRELVKQCVQFSWDFSDTCLFPGPVSSRVHIYLLCPCSREKDHTSQLYYCSLHNTCLVSDLVWLMWRLNMVHLLKMLIFCFSNGVKIIWEPLRLGLWGSFGHSSHSESSSKSYDSSWHHRWIWD